MRVAAIACGKDSGASSLLRIVGYHDITFGIHLNICLEQVCIRFVSNGEEETIDVDMSHIFELDNALTSGEIVSMPADRMLGSTKSVTKEFLGLPAKFPLGPFNIATMRGYNVIAVNVVKVKWNAYAIRVVDLPYDKEASRREQVAQLSEAYVRELERVVRKYPYQWFNFHEFWEEPKA